jgi:prepilin-type N-terminal cleavage/methylation domain-containing protein/prepilin-type processing-associated H-X9-DG protein
LEGEIEVRPSLALKATRRPGLGCVVLGCNAFTLTELVIVMAIIALLISLLLPVGSSAIEQARLLECRSNLHQLGIALIRYADEHDGAFPVSQVLDGPHPALVAAMATYLDSPGAWFCPSETDSDYVFSDANVCDGRIAYFYYSCEQSTRNGGVSTFLRWNVSWPRRLLRTDDPSTWLMSDRWFSGEPTAHRYYKKGVNYLTVDGHVDWIDESPRQAFQ